MFTYRWTWRTWYKNIYWFLYDIKEGIKNIIRWAPVIFQDRDFDWDFLARIMEYKIRRMYLHLKRFGHHAGHTRDERNMLICVELLKRLRADDHEKLPFWRHEMRMKGWERLLGKIIGRQLRCWWD
jgi:hypothetical protein